MNNNVFFLALTFSLIVTLILNPLVSVYALQQYKFVEKWGSFGTGNGQFERPHDIAFDSKGNVYVGTLNQPGVQVFNSNGTFITKWGSGGTGQGQFSIPQVA